MNKIEVDDDDDDDGDGDGDGDDDCDGGRSSIAGVTGACWSSV